MIPRLTLEFLIQSIKHVLVIQVIMIILLQYVTHAIILASLVVEETQKTNVEAVTIPILTEPLILIINVHVTKAIIILELWKFAKNANIAAKLVQQAEHALLVIQINLEFNPLVLYAHAWLVILMMEQAKCVLNVIVLAKHALVSQQIVQVAKLLQEIKIPWQKNALVNQEAMIMG